ncbi:hypothetical protein [Massilia glaciei]|nr:hypothetical protein [Massilia glaciei]
MSDVVALEAGQISLIVYCGVPERRLILVDIDKLMSVRRAEGARQPP